jgi:hypothetical protein
MRRLAAIAISAALALGLGVAGSPSAAFAAPHDGNWSVLVITEKGDCDPAYRYAVNVQNGQLKYQGDAAINMEGTVAGNGAVKVTIRLGEKGANGAGRLSGNSGTGTWQGAAANSTCAGRWEAERR